MKGVQNPLIRVIERENQMGRRLLGTVRQDLHDLTAACAGQLKQTNHIRDLMSCFAKSLIPSGWRKYKVPARFSLAEWLADFHVRLQQLQSLASMASYDGAEIRLGCLFYPEAFITASRQVAAQRHGWSLEELAMDLEMNRDDDANCFKLAGMRALPCQQLQRPSWHVCIGSQG